MALSTTSASAPAGPLPSTNPPNIHKHMNNTHSDIHSTTTNTTIPPEPEPKRPEPQYASIIRPSQDTPLNLHRTTSSLSHPDMPCVTYTPTTDTTPTTTTTAADAIYTKFSPRRKYIIVAIVSFCSFLAPVSSTTVLSAVPEVAATYGTDGSVINVSNALYMLFMGISPCFYGPYAGIYGRKWVSVASATLFTAFSIGTALAPNLAAFFVFRILTAFQGTAFLVVGSATERATALSLFLTGMFVGPALGPFIGGIVVTYRTWREIFWLQSALAGAATLFCLFLQPETIHEKRAAELEGLPAREKAAKMWEWLNPTRILRLIRYPNLLLTSLASSSLVWNMYALLTPIRYVLNPRFDLETPLQSGLFYIAPGCGYLIGTLVGGRYADHIVKKYIRIRGKRVPEDRLRSCVVFLGGIIPACMIVYGWSVEKKVGGIALPVIMMFLQGVAQLFCFPSLNTYCLDVMQGRSAEVISGNYFMRYMFGAAGSAACLPCIRAIGVGWFSTISAMFLVAGATGTYVTACYGKQWRVAIDDKKAAKKEGEGQV
ncbi:hypothetical protein LEMA_P066210.1 [Plenodomus lingam JN3]|uniref:Major facilitator superfamily (MFS) profile domain-containing protein n=1 Tax=Leptosphaeria maculans (strain JN3 / isolate v23.1.3 / race Av1-4-5-6-7-8) TaxID=985895 RepID=E4ZGS5_LEPMJ|nr:hypothetical protein LEMA_P066210.1 [Plenodomus lingam JN3]CBX90495.1 hypothetical protein LEMA_P066210.1 [Plenodomus lingam JN3]